MSIYEQLALLYVEKNAKPGTSPEELLSMYLNAYEDINICNEQHKGQPFIL